MVMLSEVSQVSQERFRAELDASFRLPLIAYFLRRVGDRAEAEDLTQEVFLRILRNLEIIDVPRAKAYVFTAAANLLRDRARQKAVRLTESRADLDGSAAPLARELIEEISPERVLLGKETLQDVLAALGELSERTRDIFVLYRIEKMKQHEIASLYGLSLSAVEKHVLKAIAHLSKRFVRP